MHLELGEVIVIDIWQDHTCQSTKNNLFVLSKDNKTGKIILWNCRRRNHGTLKEPTDPKEMTVFIATAFG